MDSADHEMSTLLDSVIAPLAVIELYVSVCARNVDADVFLVHPYPMDLVVQFQSSLFVSVFRRDGSDLVINYKMLCLSQRHLNEVNRKKIKHKKFKLIVKIRPQTTYKAKQKNQQNKTFHCQILSIEN